MRKQQSKRNITKRIETTYMHTCTLINYHTNALQTNKVETL